MSSLLEFAVFLFEDVKIVLPFSIFNRTLDSYEPFIENFLLVETDVNSPRLLIGIIIDGLEHKAIIFLILGQPQ